jgi:hypothetical protein
MSFEAGRNNLYQVYKTDDLLTQTNFLGHLNVLADNIKTTKNEAEQHIQEFVSVIFKFNAFGDAKVNQTVNYLINKLNYVNNNGKTELENCIFKLQNRLFVKPEQKSENVKKKEKNPLLKKFYELKISSNASSKNADEFFSNALNNLKSSETSIDVDSINEAPAPRRSNNVTRQYRSLQKRSNGSQAERAEDENLLKQPNCFMRFINAIINLFKRLFPCCFKKEETN